MIGEARFTYTDADMVATQSAGWTWSVRWPTLIVAYLALAVCNAGLMVGLNAAYGTQSVASEPYAVIFGSVPELGVLLGLMLLGARNHARQMLHGKLAWAWSGRGLRGEHVLAWDRSGLHIANEGGRGDLAWTAVGAWLDAPGVLLMYPSDGRALSLPEHVLAAGWRNAPKLLIFPFGGYALSLPKRAMAAGEAGALVDMLRAAGVRERRRFGMIAAKGGGAR